MTIRDVGVTKRNEPRDEGESSEWPLWGGVLTWNLEGQPFEKLRITMSKSGGKIKELREEEEKQRSQYGQSEKMTESQSFVCKITD